MPKRGLVIVDMLNTYDFADAETLMGHVEPTLDPIVTLRDRADAAGAPVLYVNDNLGRWRSDREEIIATVSSGPNARMCRRVLPREDDLLILKARHSIFFQTPFDYLVDRNDIEEVVMVGQVTEQCILYSALDAHIRHLPTVVVPDAVAGIHADLSEAALRMMEQNMNAELVRSSDVTF